jgi:hypothetical protein
MLDGTDTRVFNDPKAVLSLIGANDRVLDVGGAIEVFPRANAVVDILSYDQRRPGPLREMPEQFDREHWYVGDICAPGVWRHFGDNEFDFVICSHTLEDVRDPIFVCEQLNRVAKAGYIETPSRFRECARVSADDIYPGWEHHRWIVDVIEGSVVFTAKLAWTSLFDYLGEDRRHHAINFWNQFTAVHWIGAFDYLEHMSKGTALEVENTFFFFENYPYHKPPPCLQTIENVCHRRQTLKYAHEYQLPIERQLGIHEILQRHRERIGSSLPDGLGSDRVRQESFGAKALLGALRAVSKTRRH